MPERRAAHKADVNEVGGIPFETALHVAVQFWPQLSGRIKHRLKSVSTIAYVFFVSKQLRIVAYNYI